MVPYLVSMGFGSAQAGLIMSSIFLANIVTAPLWGSYSDATDRHRSAVTAALLLALTAISLIPLAAPLFLPVFGIGVIYSSTSNSMPALIDSWIMRRRRERPGIEYGIARGFGSAGFAIGGVVIGRLSDIYDPSIMFPVYAVVVLMTLFMIRRVPQQTKRRSVEASQTEATGIVAAGRAVLASTPYLVFVFVSLIIFIQLRAAVTFLPLLLYEVGGTNIHVGLSQTVGASSEIPAMFAAAFLLRRFRPRALLLAGMAVFILRIGLMGWLHTPELLVASQALHGISFGIFLPVSIHYIDRIAPVRFASVFQTLAPSIYFGIGSVIGSSLGGVLVERIGLRPTFRLFGAPVAVAVATFAVYLLIQRYQNQGTHSYTE